MTGPWSGSRLRGRHKWKHYLAERVATFARTSAANAVSFNDSRLISTFAKAPSIAALANANAVVRSDFIFGLVMGLSFSAIRSHFLCPFRHAQWHAGRLFQGCVDNAIGIRRLLCLLVGLHHGIVRLRIRVDRRLQFLAQL